MILIGFSTIVLLIAAWTDWKWRIIPDWLTYPSMVVAILYHSVHDQLGYSVFGGLFVFFMLMVLSLFVQDGIGGGDMKLLTFLGFALGFPLVNWVILLSFLSGLIFSKVMNQVQVPFAPFIAFSFVILLPTISMG
ncbi:A24 family peptidase [Brevibacillus brevis]|uniref:A24 family peptidase n=1 Tax=Brevibacillus brevis TaxID=1393 RepID=A0ABY9SZ10_BREBE|nr:A24 family peptidase [Brevibacillus brevis]WNC13080.1 A24 family peptidase [Brevibacillus brevis]